MAAPQVTNLPTAPARSDSPDVFAQRADNFVAALVGWNASINDATDWVNLKFNSIETNVDNAANSAVLSKDWATKTGSLVASTDYAAKEWAIGTTTADGSSKEWAIGTTTVDGSSKEWAQGDSKPSAKRWATSENLVDGTFKGSRGYALDAQTAANAAESIVNFKGKWSDLTGGADVPATVLHNDAFWVLLNDLADVTTSEPSDTNTDWQIVHGVISVTTTPIGAPDWPVTLTYDTNDNLTQALYSQNKTRFRQTLSYTVDGDLDTVLYEQSLDSGSTWDTIGTETLIYTDGNLTSTTWTEGA